MRAGSSVFGGAGVECGRGGESQAQGHIAQAGGINFISLGACVGQQPFGQLAWTLCLSLRNGSLVTPGPHPLCLYLTLPCWSPLAMTRAPGRKP